MDDTLKLARVQIVVLVTFIANRFWIRPFVVREGYTGFARTFTFSYANFCEAIVGICAITFIALYVYRRWVVDQKRAHVWTIYIGATILAAIYVILQECKFHNLGGNNVYDPVDVVFSIIGLLVAFAILAIMRPGMPTQRAV